MIVRKKTNGPNEHSDTVEVIDNANKPIAILPKDVVHRQRLQHKSVQVLIFNPEKKIYLQKRHRRKHFFPGRWDVSGRTHTRANESSVDAALRVLKDKLQLDVENPQFRCSLPACPETGFEHISIFTVNRNTLPIIPNNQEVSEGYYFSKEELTCLVKEFRELLTPNLITLWEAGLLTQI